MSASSPVALLLLLVALVSVAFSASITSTTYASSDCSGSPTGGGTPENCNGVCTAYPQVANAYAACTLDSGLTAASLPVYYGSSDCSGSPLTTQTLTCDGCSTLGGSGGSAFTVCSADSVSPPTPAPAPAPTPTPTPAPAPSPPSAPTGGISQACSDAVSGAVTCWLSAAAALTTPNCDGDFGGDVDAALAGVCTCNTNVESACSGNSDEEASAATTIGAASTYIALYGGADCNCGNTDLCDTSIYAAGLCPSAACAEVIEIVSVCVASEPQVAEACACYDQFTSDCTEVEKLASISSFTASGLDCSGANQTPSPSPSPSPAPAPAPAPTTSTPAPTSTDGGNQNSSGSDRVVASFAIMITMVVVSLL